MKRLILVLSFVLTCVALSEAREPQRGYRGFFDWDFSIGKVNFDDNLGSYNHEGILLLGIIDTTHGYQFNKHIFAGAGFLLSFAGSATTLPVYADFRYDISFGKFTPFAEMRVGGNICCESDCNPLYLSPTVGYRFNWGRKANFNLGLGLTLRGEPKYGNRVDPLFTLRLGLDF